MPWYDAYRDSLGGMVRQGASATEIAEHFKVSVSSVQSAKKALGLIGITRRGPKTGEVDWRDYAKVMRQAEEFAAPSDDHAEIDPTADDAAEIQRASKRLAEIKHELHELEERKLKLFTEREKQIERLTAATARLTAE